MTFDSVIDVGCGAGQMLDACSKAGVKIIRGVDGSWVKPEVLLIPSECFSQYDLTQPNLKAGIPETHFDLAISSEVAEHIDIDGEENFIDNLTSFSEVILFSAAVPGQAWFRKAALHHVNEQWPSYWIEKFAARGFVPVDCVRPKIWNDREIPAWYRQNLLIFVKKDALHKYPNIESEAGRPVFDVVHPELWSERTIPIRDMGSRILCRYIFTSMLYLVPAFMRAVKKRLFGCK